MLFDSCYLQKQDKVIEVENMKQNKVIYSLKTAKVHYEKQTIVITTIMLTTITIDLRTYLKRYSMVLIHLCYLIHSIISMVCQKMLV